MTTRLNSGRTLAPVSLAVALLSATMAGAALAAPASPFTLVGGIPKTLTPAALAAAQKTETKGQVSADGKTLAFGQKAVRLVVETGPDDDMLSYRIDGKRSPKLVVPAGATLKVLFVNTDDDMFHNIRFGGPLATYPNVMTPYVKASVGTPELPHKTNIALHGEDLTLRAPMTPGRYVYLCTVRGHAQGGMWGMILVR